MKKIVAALIAAVAKIEEKDIAGFASKEILAVKLGMA